MQNHGEQEEDGRGVYLQGRKTDGGSKISQGKGSRKKVKKKTFFGALKNPKKKNCGFPKKVHIFRTEYSANISFYMTFQERIAQAGGIKTGIIYPTSYFTIYFILTRNYAYVNIKI